MIGTACRAVALAQQAGAGRPTAHRRAWQPGTVVVRALGSEQLEAVRLRQGRARVGAGLRSPGLWLRAGTQQRPGALGRLHRGCSRCGCGGPPDGHQRGRHMGGGRAHGPRWQRARPRAGEDCRICRHRTDRPCLGAARGTAALASICRHHGARLCLGRIGAAVLADDNTVLCRCEDVTARRSAPRGRLAAGQIANALRHGPLPGAHLRHRGANPVAPAGPALPNWQHRRPPCCRSGTIGTNGKLICRHFLFVLTIAVLQPSSRPSTPFPMLAQHAPTKLRAADQAYEAIEGLLSTLAA